MFIVYCVLCVYCVLVACYCNIWCLFFSVKVYGILFSFVIVCCSLFTVHVLIFVV